MLSPITHGRDDRSIEELAQAAVTESSDTATQGE